MNHLKNEINIIFNERILSISFINKSNLYLIHKINSLIKKDIKYRLYPIIKILNLIINMNLNILI